MEIEVFVFKAVLVEEASVIVEVSYGDHVVNTPPSEESLFPVWNRAFCFKHDPSIDSLTFSVKHVDMETIIGTLECPLTSLCVGQDAKVRKPLTLATEGAEVLFEFGIRLAAEDPANTRLVELAKFLVVQVYAGKGIPAKSAFVAVNYGPHTFRTAFAQGQIVRASTVQEDMASQESKSTFVWDEVFRFPYVAGEHGVEVEVWTEGGCWCWRMPRLLGRTEYSLDRLPMLNRGEKFWDVLYNSMGEETDGGGVKLRVKMEGTQTAVALHTLQVHVFMARGLQDAVPALPAGCVPFIAVRYGGMAKETQVYEGDTLPVWNCNLFFDFVPGYLTFSIELWVLTPDGRKLFLGDDSVPLARLNIFQLAKAWRSIKEPAAKKGKKRKQQEDNGQDGRPATPFEVKVGVKLLGDPNAPEDWKSGRVPSLNADSPMFGDYPAGELGRLGEDGGVEFEWHVNDADVFPTLEMSHTVETVAFREQQRRYLSRDPSRRESSEEDNSSMWDEILHYDESSG